MPLPKSKPTNEDLSITEQFYNQVSESIKSVFELTSRIDERVKMLIEKQNDSDQKIGKSIEVLANLQSRLTMLESRDFIGLNKDVDNLDKRLALIESKMNNDSTKKSLEELDHKMHEMEVKNESLHLFKTGTESKIKTSVDIIFKVAVALVSAFLLWKLGIK